MTALDHDSAKVINLGRFSANNKQVVLPADFGRPGTVAPTQRVVRRGDRPDRPHWA